MNWKRIESDLLRPGLLDAFARSAHILERQMPGGNWVPQVSGRDWRVETNGTQARLSSSAGRATRPRAESELYFALKDFLLHWSRAEDTAPQAEPREAEIGLVLSGGGARGAYEAGAWRALCESGLAAHVTGFSGTSIGAINSLLFASRDWREAQELWMSMSDPAARRPVRDEIERYTGAYTQRRRTSLLPPWLLDLMEDRFLSQPELERSLFALLKGGAGEKIRATRTVFSTVTPLAEAIELLPELFGAEHIDRAQMGSDSRCYIPWSNLSNAETVQLIMASSAIPPVYRFVEFRGGIYYDGGLYDNTPVRPLIQAGYRRIIVVQLSRERPGRSVSTVPEDCQVLTICPSFQESALATFSLSPEETSRRIRQGYEDGLRAIETLPQRWGAAKERSQRTDGNRQEKNG